MKRDFGMQGGSAHWGLYLLFMSAIMIWGGNWVVGKIVASQADSLTNMMVRFIIELIGFVVVLMALRIPIRLRKKHLIPLFAAGCCEAAFQWHFFQGLQFGLASYGGIIVTTLSPVYTHLAENILNKKGFTSRELLGFLCAIGGMALVIEVWSLDVNRLFQSGNLFFLIAPVFWAAITIINHRIQIHPLLFVMCLSVPGLVLGLLLLPLQPIISAFQLGWHYLVPISFLALFGTLYAGSINFKVVQVIGPKRATSFLFLIPVFALFFSWVFLHEPLGLSLILGGALASLGVYLLNQ